MAWTHTGTARAKAVRTRVYGKDEAGQKMLAMARSRDGRETGVDIPGMKTSQSPQGD